MTPLLVVIGKALAVTCGIVVAIGVPVAALTMITGFGRSQEYRDAHRGRGWPR